MHIALLVLASFTANMYYHSDKDDGWKLGLFIITVLSIGLSMVSYDMSSNNG